MTLVRWRPTNGLMARPWRIFDRLLDDQFWSTWAMPRLDDFVTTDFHMPPVDVSEEDGHVLVRAELPGVDKEHLKLKATADQLTIEAERNSDVEAREGRYYRRELHTGRSYRCVPMPVEVKYDEAKATFKNGVLEVRIPKAEEAVARTIEIE